MKRKLTLLLLTLSIMVSAQQQNKPAPQLEVIDNPNYKNFKQLNVNNIPTGVLLEYGYSQLDVTKFNGTLQDSTYTTKQSISAIYYTFTFCHYAKKKQCKHP